MAVMGDGLGCVILYTDVPKVLKSIHYHAQVIALVIKVTPSEKHEIFACSNAKNGNDKMAYILRLLAF